MRTTRFGRFIAAIAALALCGTASADGDDLALALGDEVRVVKQGGRIRVLRGIAAGPYDGTATQAATAFLAEHAALLGAADVGFAHERTWRGRTAVHFQQLHRGVPVVGGAVVVRIDTRGHAVMVGSSLAPSLELDVAPVVDPQQAAAIAVATVTAAGSTDAQLAVLPGGRGGRLVYRVRVETATPIALWMVTVDATTAAVLDATDLRLDAQGNVYPHSPANSEVTEVELTDLDGDGTAMDGTYALVRSVTFEGDVMSEEHLAVAEPGGDFLYTPVDPASDDPFAEVHTYWHVTELSRYFEDAHGHVFDGQALVTTNYRYTDDGTFDNAYFTNSIMGDTLLVFGQGTIDFAYDADVVAHEFGHSVVQSLTQMLFDGLISYDEYGWNIAPGAIHEGMADYWSSTYHDDPVMGEYLAVLGATRDLDNDRACPGDVMGEPHWDGEIVGGTTWEIRELLGAEIADTLLYGALGQLTPTPSFADLAEAISQVGDELEDDGVVSAGQLADLETILQERGLYLCGREMPLEDGVPQTVPIPGAQLLSEDLCGLARQMGAVFSTHFQYSVTLPSAIEGTIEQLALTFELERQDNQPLGADDLQYSLYVRKDDLVIYEFDYLDLVIYELALPQALEFDVAEEDLTDASYTLVLDAEGEIVLEPGATYYFGMVHMNCPMAYLTVTADMTFGGSPGDDDDDTVGDDDLEELPDDDEEESGCGCSATRRVTPSAVLAVLLTAALLRRTRR